jgi:hypothetical protein
MKKVLWTSQEDELSAHLFRQRAPDEVFRQLLGRSKRTCEDRRTRLRRQREGMGSNAVHHYVMGAKVNVPDEVYEDRNKRMIARMQMDLTSVLCGDPEPGRRRA